VSIDVWVYFGVFDLILLINVSDSLPMPNSFVCLFVCFTYYCSVEHLEIGDSDTSRTSFIV